MGLKRKGKTVEEKPKNKIKENKKRAWKLKDKMAKKVKDQLKNESCGQEREKTYIRKS